ncbi:DUF1129 family protein [Oceanobacillus longus]|uniref:DUF1129 family protein n=1 Tax=Oceanobacillus longus TaxID=930120 RepID=A0ABV8GZS4_9BACI
MIKQEVALSRKSRKFLEDLRVYLFSSGKNELETNEIVEELEDHLIEAEKNGKSIEHIVGQSPKSYMRKISNEMTIDYKAWIKYIPIILFGAFSFVIIGDLFEGLLSYSLMEILGFIAITALFLAGVSVTFRYVSANNVSTRKQFIIFFLLGMFPMCLFIGLIFLNGAISTPIIHFGMTGSIITAILTFIFVLAVSIWAKTWVILVLLALLTLPDFFLSYTTMTESPRLITGTMITFGGIAIYLFLTSRMNKA